MKIQHTLDTATFVDGLKRVIQTKKESDVNGVHSMTVSGSVEYDTGSYDPDGATVSYAWTQTAGTPVVLGGAGTATPGFTAPNSAETLTFRLTVTDDKGISVSDEVTIVVSRSGT
ncbi:MAG: hypothetical protein AABZ10_16210 [Nitrospirota bacterium]